MSESLHADRRTLVQINATILAGILIFMTLEGFRGLITIPFIVGLYLIIISLGLSLVTTKGFGKEFPISLLERRLVSAQIFLIIGLLVLFSGIVLILTGII